MILMSHIDFVPAVGCMFLNHRRGVGLVANRTLDFFRATVFHTFTVNIAFRRRWRLRRWRRRQIVQNLHFRTPAAFASGCVHFHAVLGEAATAQWALNHASRTGRMWAPVTGLSARSTNHTKRAGRPDGRPTRRGCGRRRIRPGSRQFDVSGLRQRG